MRLQGRTAADERGRDGRAVEVQRMQRGRERAHLARSLAACADCFHDVNRNTAAGSAACPGKRTHTTVAALWATYSFDS